MYTWTVHRASTGPVHRIDTMFSGSSFPVLGGVWQKWGLPNRFTLTGNFWYFTFALFYFMESAVGQTYHYQLLFFLTGSHKKRKQLQCRQSKSERVCKCMCPCMHACVCSRWGRSRLFGSTCSSSRSIDVCIYTYIYIYIYIYLTGYSDWLTGFHEQLLLPYTVILFFYSCSCHTSLKNVQCDHCLILYRVQHWWLNQRKQLCVASPFTGYRLFIE